MNRNSLFCMVFLVGFHSFAFGMEQPIPDHLDAWTTTETVTARVASVTEYRDFAQQQSNEETVHPSLRLQANHNPVLYNNIRRAWSLAATKFGEALELYNADNLIEGDKRLSEGLVLGKRAFMYITTYKTDYTPEQYRNGNRSIWFGDVYPILADSIADIPGNPGQYPHSCSQ
ncbi:MAG: hypothetical protein IJ730_02760 [Alphaproteobacteria bacterium]|nr:hypothetical protein [Alphaproteobacteria bacterium]